MREIAWMQLAQEITKRTERWIYPEWKAAGWDFVDE